MSWCWLAVIACIGSVAATNGIAAQSPPPPQSFAPNKEKPDPRLAVPKAYMPPAGMCRIWLDDVPAAQQPAPTDCATAIKNRPTKGKVIFGDDSARKDRDAKGEDKAKPKKP